MNIAELGQRIDINTARQLIAYSAGRSKPVARCTVYRMERDGRFPARIKSPLPAAVWDTAECLEKLGLK